MCDWLVRVWRRAEAKRPWRGYIIASPRSLASSRVLKQGARLAALRPWQRRSSDVRILVRNDPSSIHVHYLHKIDQEIFAFQFPQCRTN